MLSQQAQELERCQSELEKSKEQQKERTAAAVARKMEARSYHELNSFVYQNVSTWSICCIAVYYIDAELEPHFLMTILEVEEELEALKRKYQKNMALVSRQSKARLYRSWALHMSQKNRKDMKGRCL